MKIYLYLAHPISGLTGNEVFKYYDDICTILSKNYKILSPMIGKNYLRNNNKCIPNGYKNAISNDHSIFQRDTWMVNQSDVVFCDFTGSKKVSIGCCMELAIASFLNKHTIIIMNEENIHNHSFILESADIIFDTFNEGINYLIELGESIG